MTNAIRTATSGKMVQVFCIPQDVIESPVTSNAIDLCEQPQLGVPNSEDIQDVIKAIKHEKFPVLLVGEKFKESNRSNSSVAKSNLPVVETFRVPVYLTVN